MTTGCGASAPTEPERAALARQAHLAGVAIDAWWDHPSVRLADPREPDTFSAVVLRHAGITLDHGMNVTRYTSDFRRIRSEERHENFQFCLTDADGNWVTYGDVTGVQKFGPAGQDTCVFTGKPLPQAPFDARRFAQHIYDTLHFRQDLNDGRESLLAWDHHTSGSNPKATALVEKSLPDGWKTSQVDQRGYLAHQYCLTAPSGEWYYVHDSNVEGYDDTGSCHLDPQMPGVN